MTRPLLRSAEASLLRDLLHPARPERAAGSAPPGLLARLGADPALARAVPVALSRLSFLAPEDRAEAEAIRAWCATRVAAMRAALLPLGLACARERVPAFLVKGAALHGLLYPDPAVRPAADVDLFVPARHVARFHALLLALDFAPGADSAARAEAFEKTGARRPWLIDLSYAVPAGDLAVEVKADPIAVGRPPRRLDPFAEGGTPSPVYPGLLVPSAETMVLQQAMSLARRPEPDLLAHAELAGVLYVRRAELDPERLLDLVRGDGLYGILRGVLEDTDAAFPGVVPRALLARRGRPAGYTPPRIRRGTFAAPRKETTWTRLSFWAAPALRGAPTTTLAWLKDRVLPPQPLLSALTGGRTGVSAWWARLASLSAR